MLNSIALLHLQTILPDSLCDDLVSLCVPEETDIQRSYVGCIDSTRIAKQALQSGRGVLDLVREEGLLDDATLSEIQRPANPLCQPCCPVGDIA
ncbi:MULTISPECIES: hypothetical protein [Halomonas]|uniref:hypothetical protein n=1 Tax=Halomonas TaxID=2745 RepID=UPI0018685167|nr:hypothetical protein [Halomonas colorata]